ncbi:MAG: hypothetical protein ACRD2W_02150 [Acidimicrobiales bacterium]
MTSCPASIQVGHETREALTLPGVEVGPWCVRECSDRVLVAFADRHYPRRSIGWPVVGPPGHRLALVTPCERAVWLTHYTDHPDDGLDAWRCSIFRNEGAGLSSVLILSAMAMTAEQWGAAPPDGWVTFVDPRKVNGTNPGYCFLVAGWWRDRNYEHPHLIRLRAAA